jgi:hypothetical protein
MKNIVLISASPKINEPSVSEFLVDALGSHIDGSAAEKYVINVRQSFTHRKTHDDFAVISQADAIIITFPLYVFCLPGMLMRFLEDYQQYYIESGQNASQVKVYAIVNCGFPEPGINLEAVRVIRSFSQHVNMNFRFGILIGGGGMLLGTKDAPIMKKTLQILHDAFAKIIEDIENADMKEMDNINITMNFPRRMYLFMGNRGWFSQARKNGLKKKDLYKRPYQI